LVAASRDILYRLKILIRAANWVGDAVMSLPAVQAVRRRYPESQIAVLAKPWVAGLYGREPSIDRVIVYDAKNWMAKVRFAWNLRAERFDCAILLQNAFEAAALARIAGIPKRIGYARDGRGWLLTGPVRVPNKGEIPAHQRFYYLELLRRAGWIDEMPRVEEIRLAGAAEARAAGAARFEKMGWRGVVIGVSPGAAYGGAKRWLSARFAEAAAKLAAERQGAVAVFGSAGERAICEEVARAVEAAGIRSRNFAGETRLDEFLELAAACSLFLTNDSGSMHIASALGTPTVAVFGATDDRATGPTGRQARVVKRAVECSPCLLRECPIDHRCMTGLTVNDVTEAAEELWTLEAK
jgi:heptosyltransferase II